jgi:hypothetical protein
MKDFIKTFWGGLQIVIWSLGAIMCFVIQFPLYKFLINAKGFLAVLIFIGMAWFLVSGIVIIWMLGVLVEKE